VVDLGAGVWYNRACFNGIRRGSMGKVPEDIMNKLRATNKRKPVVNPQNEEWIRSFKPVERPNAEWLMDAVPELTPFEKASALAEEQRFYKPHTSKMPDPRRPWSLKGTYVVEKISEITEGPKTFDEAQAKRGIATPGQPQGVQDRIRLNNIHAKIKQGKRLTKAEKKMYAKWNFARLMARFRPAR